jgi:hypothetical protein
MFVFGVVVIEVWETDLPVWGFVLTLLICAFCLVFRHRALSSRVSHSLCLAFLYTPPLSVIRATTNQQPGLNVIMELIIGYALPGRPVAMMLFKTWGYNTQIRKKAKILKWLIWLILKISPLRTEITALSHDKNRD